MATDSNACLIVGIGNPGDEYELTRHNFGFLVLDRLSRKHQLIFKMQRDGHGRLSHGKVDGKECYLLMPQTYVNESGRAVKAVLEQHPLSTQNMLVISDDLHLSFGQLRVRDKGRDGGHNGLRSIIEKLGTQNFGRLRLGIGAPRDKEQTVEYVLGRFTKSEEKQLDEILEKAVDCCEVWLKEGQQRAMEQFNQRADINQ